MIKGALALSMIGAPVEDTTILKFQINNYFTHPDERIAVTGDVPELGCWDRRRSAPLESINGDTWFNEIPFDESVGEPICFKFVVLKENAEHP